MLQAAKTGDRDTVFALLSPADPRAARASRPSARPISSARRMRYTAKDLVSIGSSRGRGRADRHHRARGARRSRDRRDRVARGALADAAASRSTGAGGSTSPTTAPRRRSQARRRSAGAVLRPDARGAVLDPRHANALSGRCRSPRAVARASPDTIPADLPGDQQQALRARRRGTLRARHAEAPLAGDAQGRDRRDRPRQHARRPVPLARGRDSARGPGVDEGAGRLHARRAREAAGPRASSPTRLKQLFYYDAISAPTHRKGRYFYTRKHADKEKAIVYWKQGENGAEKVLFDPNTWSTDGTQGLGGWWPSYDGKYVAYAVKENNSDETDDARCIEVATGKDLPDVDRGHQVRGRVVDARRQGLLLHVGPAGRRRGHDRRAPGLRRGAVPQARHRPGERSGRPPGDRQPEDVPRRRHLARRPLAGRRRSSTAGTRPTCYFKDARKPNAAWQPLVKGVDATFAVDVWKDQFYVTTNDGAPRYRVFKVDPDASSSARAWKEIVPQSDATLESVEHRRRATWSLTYLRNAATELEVRDARRQARPQGRRCRRSARRAASAATPTRTPATSRTRRSPSRRSSTRPRSRPARSTSGRAIKLPIDTVELATEQVFYPSKDGTKVSMFIIHKKGTQKDGKNPTLLYGYGGFNVNMTPAFASSRAVWLERGGMYAIPNLRGGGEYGEDWHRAGMLLNKQNVFDDFIAAAEYLIKEGWTTREHLAISRRLERRPARRRGDDAAPGAVQGRGLRGAAARHGALPPVRLGQDVGPGVRLGRGPGAVQGALRVLAVPLAVDAGTRAYPAVLFDSADTTTASIRCTRASSPRSSRPRPDRRRRRSCCASSATPATAAPTW